MSYLFPILILFLFAYIWKKKYGGDNLLKRFTIEEQKEIIYKIQESNSKAFDEALKEHPIGRELNNERMNQQMDEQSMLCSKFLNSYLNKIADEYGLSNEELLRFKNLAILTKFKSKVKDS